MKLSVEKQNAMLDLYLALPEKRLSLDQEEITEFLELAAHSKVGANLYLQLKRANIDQPAHLMGPLEKTYQKIRAKNIKRLEVGLPILRELKLAGIEVIILKGNSIAEELFSDIGYKPMNDIDILVKSQDLNAIHEIFLKNHLLTAAPLESDFRKQEKYSHHWPPFFDRKLDLFLGTHWNIAAPTRGLKIPIADFWKEKEEFLLMGESFYRLNPKHMILHLCVHLNAAKTGLREIGDLVKVIEAHESTLNVSTFVAMVKKAKAESVVYESLSGANALKSSPFITSVLRQLDVAPKQIAQVARRFSPRHKMLHTRTNYISKIEKTFALFMLTEDPLEKTFLLARMWKLYLLVPPREALRLNYDFPENSLGKKMIASITAPLKVSEVFIKDLGFLIFLIVTMRHQWVLLKSYGEFIRKKLKGEPVSGLDSFAKKLGLSMSEIKEIQGLD